jgi:hypothetical protein
VVLAALAGFAGPVMAGVVGFVMLDARAALTEDRGGPVHERTARARPPDEAGDPRRSTGEAPPQRASTDAVAVRRIARRQLREAGRELATCRQRPAGRRRDCLRWPFAHLSMAGRTNAHILWAAGERLRSGPCRDVVLGGANAMRLVGHEADLLSRSFLEPSSPMAEHERTGRRLIVYLRRQLDASAWRTC